MPSAGQSVVDSRDVINCFQLFLGRDPENAAGGYPSDSRISDLLRHIFDTNEFKSGVLRALLLREKLPHAALSDVLLFPVIDWAQQRLPISLWTRRTTGGARTWTQLLELLLADPSLIAVAPALVEAEVDRVLRMRLSEEPLFRVRRSVVGSVDSASAYEIRGWAVDLCNKSVPVVLQFYADDTLLGSIPCVEPRADVRDVVGGDGKAGFTFRISPADRASFLDGCRLTAVDAVSHEQVGAGTVVHAEISHTWDAIAATRNEIATLRQILDRIEARLPEVSRMASIPVEAYDEYWMRFYRPVADVLAQQRIQSLHFAYRPHISVVMPARNSDIRLLEKAIQSVLGQTYDCWELIVSDDASRRDELGSLRRRYESEPRIRWTESETHQGIAANTNQAIVAATGDYVAFLDHDDEISPDALYYAALALQERHYGLLYSDEDRIEENEFGRCVHFTPFFKPDFDPDLLLSVNYMCHLVVVNRELLAAVGGLRTGFDGAQDHDLLLRVIQRSSPSDIRHIPRILYHWRLTPGSVSSTFGHAEPIQRNMVAAVQDHLRELSLPASVEPHSDPVGAARQFAARVRWKLPTPGPAVSIIVPTRDRIDLLRPCLDSVLDSLGDYPGEYEIIIVDNDSAEESTRNYFSTLSSDPRVRILPFRGPFNWSAINNMAAHRANGQMLIFLNNDTLVLTRDWCVELVANAVRHDVGAVGARLLYSDGTIQHAGVVLEVEGVAGHEAVGDNPRTGGYFGRTHLLRSAAAVTAACMATRRSVFLDAGGFDELNLKVAFNDVDYCMKLRKAGYRIVFNPFAVLYHLESKSRGRDLTEAQQLRHRGEAAAFHRLWSHADLADPYYNPHFERFARPFERLRCPPISTVPAGAAWLREGA